MNDLDRVAARRVVRAAREQDLNVTALTYSLLGTIAALSVPHVGIDVMTAVFVDAAQFAWEGREAAAGAGPAPRGPAERAKAWEPEFGGEELAFVVYRTTALTMINIVKTCHTREELIAYAMRVIDAVRELAS